MLYVKITYLGHYDPIDLPFIHILGNVMEEIFFPTVILLVFACINLDVPLNVDRLILEPLIAEVLSFLH